MNILGPIKLRKAARKLNIRRRFNALTSKERVQAKRWRRLALISFLASDIMRENGDNDEDLEELADICALRWIQIIRDTAGQI